MRFSHTLLLPAPPLRPTAATSSGTKVVFMGESGYKDAQGVARALRKLGGRRSYVLTGGFQAWRDRGLLTASSYAVGGVEGFVEEARETYTEAAVLTQETLSEVAEKTLQQLLTADEAVRSIAAVPVPQAMAGAAEAGAAAAAGEQAGAAAAPVVVAAAKKEEPVVAV